MTDVFQNLKFALQYEQRNLNIGSENAYGRFASESIDLAEINSDSIVLDVGCGTGISTTTLVDKVKNVTITATDRSPQFQEIAKLKFGLSENVEKILSVADVQTTAYQDLLKEKWENKDLSEHLKSQIRKYSNFKDNLDFHILAHNELEKLNEEFYDVVLLSQGIHWFRNNDGKIDLNYEKECLQGVERRLKKEGTFVFNTNGEFYDFEDKKLNEMHISFHPFYTSFYESVYSQLGLKVPKNKKNKAFNDSEIKKALKENGFNIIRKKNMLITRKKNSLIETCLVCSGNMSIFQSEGINLSYEDRFKVIKKAVDDSLKRGLLETKPVAETGVHYVAKKS